MIESFSISAEPAFGLGHVCREVLETVPDWFGRPESNEEYIEFVNGHPTWIASAPDGTAVGIISGRKHFPETAEIEVMAVKREWHRRGVGRALVEAFERHHAANGVRMIEVKTLGPSYPDVGYEHTRAFYMGIGFIRIEELLVWDPETPALLLCKPIVRSDGHSPS